MITGLVFAALAVQRPPMTATKWETVGRFQKSAQGVSCEWPGSAIRASISASRLTAEFTATTDNDRWQVEIDGRPTQVLKLGKGNGRYTIDLPNARMHHILLVRRSEAFQGATEFRGFGGNGLRYQNPSDDESIFRKDRRIEIIGDSISAGYGVDGKKKEEPYSPDTANAYLTYGWVAARQLKALPTIVAWSGKKMWPDNTIPEIYDYVFPSTKSGAWSPDAAQKPQAVVINLATNDFGRGIPDEKGWKGGYTVFLKKVRKNYPSSYIYLVTGSMMSDSWPAGAKHLSTLKSWLDSIQTTMGDSKIKRLDFPVQQESDGIGSSWHPNAVTQAKMGRLLAVALKGDLGWR
jgi:hypothetical protein